MKERALNRLRAARRRTPPGRSGLTLVEVLVALTILSLALLTYLNVILAASRTASKGDYHAIAGRAAETKVAQLQDTAFSSLTDGTTNYTVSGLPQGQMTVVIGPLDGNAANTNIKQADITVTWQGSGGAARLGGQARVSALLSAGR